MRRGGYVLLLSVALVLLATAPGIAAASGYKVWKPSGAAVGRVVPEPVTGQGDWIGVVHDLDGFRGAVYSKQSSAGYWGWPVKNASSYVAWVKKVNSTRFSVSALPGGPATVRATRLSSGTWLAQKKSGGRWATIGRVQKGCRGQWAAGAARLLLGRQLAARLRAVRWLPGRSWDDQATLWSLRRTRGLATSSVFGYPPDTARD